MVSSPGQAFKSSAAMSSAAVSSSFFTSPDALPGADGLEQDLHQLRLDMEVERLRSRDLAYSMRAQISALDAEQRDSDAAQQDLAIAVGAATNYAVGNGVMNMGQLIRHVSSEDGSSAFHDEQQQRASQAQVAIQLAGDLHASVQGLMGQGLEFRALVARREAELQAALQASEHNRLLAEAAAAVALRTNSARFGRSSDDTGDAGGTGGAEDRGLCSAERDVHEAVVRRLEAQVQALELQVECLTAECAVARASTVSCSGATLFANQAFGVLSLDAAPTVRENVALTTPQGTPGLATRSTAGPASFAVAEPQASLAHAGSAASWASPAQVGPLGEQQHSPLASSLVASAG